MARASLTDPWPLGATPSLADNAQRALWRVRPWGRVGADRDAPPRAPAWDPESEARYLPIPRTMPVAAGMALQAGPVPSLVPPASSPAHGRLVDLEGRLLEGHDARSMRQAITAAIPEPLAALCWILRYTPQPEPWVVFEAERTLRVLHEDRVRHRVQARSARLLAWTLRARPEAALPWAEVAPWAETPAGPHSPGTEAARRGVGRLLGRWRRLDAPGVWAAIAQLHGDLRLWPHLLLGLAEQSLHHLVPHAPPDLLAAAHRVIVAPPDAASRRLPLLALIPSRPDLVVALLRLWPTMPPSWRPPVRAADLAPLLAQGTRPDRVHILELLGTLPLVSPALEACDRPAPARDR